MATTAAILLSRQARGACANSTWVQRTKEAVAYLANNHLKLNSSIGLRTWDLITILASDAGLTIRLFVPATKDEDFQAQQAAIRESYEINPIRTTFVPIVADAKSSAMQLRDRLIIERSDLLLPVSLRPRGTMARWLDHAARCQRIDRRFETDYEIERQLGAKDYSKRSVNMTIDRTGSEFLWHWTRTVDHRWPGETIAAYCRAIASSDTYPRGARDTLTRIATSRLLLASDRHMPNNTPTVSFTALPPSHVIPLMRWRARYGEMSFEPYAIGISTAVAVKLGVQPVVYYDRGIVKPTGPAWLTQSRGRITNWSAELEWRHKGDLDLRAVDPSDLLLICESRSDIGPIEKASGLRALALFED